MVKNKTDKAANGAATPTDDAKVVPLKSRKCAMCAKPAVQEFRPFCSRRCANLDLGNWLDESYRVPTNEVSEDEEAFGEED